MIKTITLPSNETVKTLARQLLTTVGIKEPPVNLLLIAEHLNAEVYLSDELPDEVHGCVIPLKDGRFIILINVFTPENRRIFTLAHEIGHICLRHYRLVGKLRKIEINQSRLDEISKKIERLADVFASELLMPKHMVQRYYRDCGGNVTALAQTFTVSEEAIKIKLKELNLLVE